MNAETLVQVRADEWNREVAMMQLHEAAVGMPMSGSATGDQLRKLLVNALTALWTSVSRRPETRTA
jgi:hypothetical protein